MISRLLLAKTAVLWVFVAPLCAVLALVVGLAHDAALLIGAEIIAICVVPVACLPVTALVGIRWPYHPLQLRYRWDHRVPLRRMIVRWLILAVVPYALVPALCVLMTVPAFILLVLTHSANSHVISFVDAEGKPFGLVLSGPGHPLSGGMQHTSTKGTGLGRCRRLTLAGRLRSVRARSCQLVPCPGSLGRLTVRPCSDRYSADGRSDCGLPVKPRHSSTPTGPPA